MIGYPTIDRMSRVVGADWRRGEHESAQHKGEEKATTVHQLGIKAPAWGGIGQCRFLAFGELPFPPEPSDASRLPTRGKRELQSGL